MFKKIISITLILSLLSACGFTPIYSSKNMKNKDFSIEVVSIDGDRDINNQINLHLRKYQNDLKIKKLISINTVYKKNIYLKDSTGDASEYKLEVTANINVNSKQKFLISESFNMKKMTNLFDQSNYEKTIKKNFADSIVEKLLLKLAISNDI
tara:strand:+ start:163 stop:621 length:459 start_codon:yes stop_codon:yes gene_type:complete